MRNKIIIALLFTILAYQPALALSLPGASAPAAEKTDAAPTTPKDELGRDTPQGLAKGFLQAVADKDYAEAAKFLDLSDLPKSQQAKGPEIVQQLQSLLDESGWIKPQNTLSDDPMGDQKDDLPPGTEKIGGIRTTTKTVPVLAERITPKKAAAYWVISSDTIIQIPELAKTARTSLLNKYLPQKLIDNQIAGVAIGHWLALIVIIASAYFIVWLISSLIFAGIMRILRRDKSEKAENKRAFANVFIKPIQLFLALVIALVCIRIIGISLLARQVFMQMAEVTAWICFTWIIWGLIDVFADIFKRRLVIRSQFGVISAIVFFRRGAKFALLILVSITVLDSFGFQVTTWLAALGIGGLAIALGAQKTVENFVGSLTVITDRPINIGDLCKFGTTTGTVEDIGMRSTKVRTSERSLVSIPNGEFSSMQIENFSKRDKYLFNPKLNLRPETTPDQIRYLLVELRKLLYAYTKILSGFHVNFTGFAASSINIEISAYINAANADEAADIREDLLLRVMDIINSAGTGFATPSQTVYMARDKMPDGELAEKAEQKFAEWKTAGKFQQTNFSNEEVSDLDTIKYPPEKK